MNRDVGGGKEVRRRQRRWTDGRDLEEGGKEQLMVERSTQARAVAGRQAPDLLLQRCPNK
jgi:hypothetical protein